MYKKTKEEFIKLCENKKCPKHYRYNNKTCIKEYRRNQCYKTYILSIERKEQKLNDKITNDLEWTNEVWLKYAGYNFPGSSKVSIDEGKRICAIWNVLSKQEQDFIEVNYKYDFLSFIGELNICHVINQSKSKKYKQDIDNVYLGSVYFHRLLTDFQHPVTRKIISKEEVIDWNIKAKSRIE